MLAALEVLDEDGKPSRERTVYFQSKALESGVLVGAKPALGLLRFLPPYVISQNEVEAALQVLEEVAKSIS